MATYIILSRVTPGAFREPADFKKIAGVVMEKTSKECPGVVFKDSFATMGRFDFVDIVESDDPAQVEKVAMYIRGYAQSETETLPATPWKEFLARL